LFVGIISFVLFALFLGNSYNETALVNRANVIVVDYDPGTPLSAGLKGFIQYWNTQNITNITGIYQTLPTLVYQDGTSLYPGGTPDIIDRIETVEGNVYGALVLAPGSFATLYEALVNPTAPIYNPYNVLTLIYDEGYNMNFIDGFIFADVLVAAIFFSYNFVEVLTTDVVVPMLQNATMQHQVIAAMAHNPLAFTTPVSFNLINTHPVEATTAALVGAMATSTAVIFEFIFSMLVALATFFITTHLGKVHHVNTWHLQIFRVMSLFASSFLMSLLIAVQVPMFGGSMYLGWGPYWLLVWFTLLGFQLIVMSLFVAFPQPVAGILMIFFLISNAASATFGAPLEVTNSFYLYGYMMPYRATISAGRHILFGSSNQLYRDMPILAAWIVVPFLLIFFSTFIHGKFAIYKAKKAKKAEVSKA